VFVCLLLLLLLLLQVVAYTGGKCLLGSGSSGDLGKVLNNFLSILRLASATLTPTRAQVYYRSTNSKIDY